MPLQHSLVLLAHPQLNKAAAHDTLSSAVDNLKIDSDVFTIDLDSLYQFMDVRNINFVQPQESFILRHLAHV